MVGASGYILNLAVFAGLVNGAGAHYLFGATVAFCVAWTSNFMLNKHWTFRRHGLSTLQQGLRYFAVNLVGFSLNLLILHILVTAGMVELGAQAIAIAAVTPVNFLLSRRWSFR